MPEHRRNTEVLEMPSPYGGEDSAHAPYSGFDRSHNRFESSNDNAALIDLRSFRLTRRQTVLSIGFATGAVVALFSMLNGSSLYQAESRIFVDVKQAQIQSGASASPSMDPETVSRIVNEKLLVITSQPVLTKVVENLGLQRTRLFNNEDDTDLATSFAAWYRSFFQKEPLGSVGVEYSDPQDQLERAVSLTPSEDSAVIAINVTTNKARTSALIANQFAEVLKQAENKPAPVSTITQSDLDMMLIRVQKADRDVSDFQVQTPIVDRSNDVSEITNELSDLRDKMQIIQKNIDLLKKSGSNAATLNVIPEDLLTAKLFGLKGQIRDAQSKVIQLQQNLGPKHPDLLAAQKAVDAFTADIKKELPSLAKVLDADLTNKKAAETLLAQELENRTKNASSDSSTNKPSLDDLQKQAETLHSQYASMVLNGPNRKAPDPIIRLVSKATVPTSPIRAGFATTFFAVLVGGFIGTLIAGLGYIGRSDIFWPQEEVQPPRYHLAEQHSEEQQAPEEDVDSYLAELSLAEAALEAREKELELREILLLNSRLERLTGMLDRANDGLAVHVPLELEPRQYPAPAEDLYERVYSQAANVSYPVSTQIISDFDNSRDLDRVRDDLRSLRGKVARYAGKRA